MLLFYNINIKQSCHENVDNDNDDDCDNYEYIESPTHSNTHYRMFPMRPMMYSNDRVNRISLPLTNVESI